jgi:sulfide:quinone oxidoreductase
MAHIVIMGAGIGGMPAAYEMRAALPKEHRSPWSTRWTTSSSCRPTPGWRWAGASATRSSLQVGPLLERKGIEFIAKAVTQIDAAGNKLVLAVATAGLRLPGHHHRPQAQLRRGARRRPARRPHAFGLHGRPCRGLLGRLPGVPEEPRPGGRRRHARASCFGPAYEFAFILDADLRKRKLRNKVPITFVTSEPYIGHLGLGGVGDSKSMLESELRGHDIKWITNAKTTKVEAGKLFVTQLDDLGKD